MEACIVKKKTTVVLFQVFHADEMGITLTLSSSTITNDFRSQLTELNASYYLQSFYKKIIIPNHPFSIFHEGCRVPCFKEAEVW